MKLSRLFSGNVYKGTRDYLRTQKYYEIARTVLMFALSLSLFAAGYLTTKTRVNLLTIVAVLGCLPACQSAVSAFLFCRYKGLSPKDADRIEAHNGSLLALFDMVFTGYEKTFVIEHLVIRKGQICGYSSSKTFDEKAFDAHIQPLLKANAHKNISVKIFTDLQKYTDRLDQLEHLEDADNSASVADTLKSVSL